MLRFAANISWLFKEKKSLLDRITEASKHGFKYIELAWPYDYTVEQFSDKVKGAKLGTLYS